MANHRGVVIETRGPMVVIRCAGESIEREFDLADHDVFLGDILEIDEAGIYELVGRVEPEPETIQLPGPQHDHS